mmetsp:Transcript_43154/g.139104  ORF Transcript_43154/g.139104 Transcript_43154/m.139104 type:complete len:288 (+) Transcript_43154:636-1499(+)
MAPSSSRRCSRRLPPRRRGCPLRSPRRESALRPAGCGRRPLSAGLTTPPCGWARRAQTRRRASLASRAALSPPPPRRASRGRSRRQGTWWSGAPPSRRPQREGLAPLLLCRGSRSSQTRRPPRCCGWAASPRAQEALSARSGGTRCCWPPSALPLLTACTPSPARSARCSGRHRRRLQCRCGCARSWPSRWRAPRRRGARTRGCGACLARAVRSCSSLFAAWIWTARLPLRAWLGCSAADRSAWAAAACTACAWRRPWRVRRFYAGRCCTRRGSPPRSTAASPRPSV